MVSCMFSANLSALGLFLPITAAVIILCNVLFGILWIKKIRRKKPNQPPPSDPTS